MSSELNANDTFPSNAGVSFINVPYMRQTYDQFLAYIVGRKEKGGVFDHPSPSDQGAYLSFYNDTVSFLIQRFNYKPYWDVQGPNFDDPFILHFHGAKPHDYLKFIFGSECDTAIASLCDQAESLPHLCEGFKSFSKYVDREEYCNGAFSETPEKVICKKILDSIAASPLTQCEGSFSKYLIKSMALFELSSDSSRQSEVHVRRNLVGKKPQFQLSQTLHAGHGHQGCFSEYLLVGWQLFLSLLSLSCIVIPAARMLGTSKKPQSPRSGSSF